MEGNKKELEVVMAEKLELQNKIFELQQQHNNQMQDLLYKHRNLETQHQTTTSSLNMSRAENESLKLTIDCQRGQLNAMQSELELLKNNLARAETICKEREKMINDMEITIEDKTKTIAELESQIREDEAMRKKLHNTIQELKGNIRVYCRVRPLLGSEIAEFGNVPSTFDYPPFNDRTLDISTSSVSIFCSLQIYLID